MFEELQYKKPTLFYSFLHFANLTLTAQTTDQKEQFLPHALVSKFGQHSLHVYPELER